MKSAKSKMPVVGGVESWTQGRGFAVAISDCPASLKRLVLFYRYLFGCSFSGVIFADSRCLIQSLLLMIVNLAVMAACVVPFLVIPAYFPPSKPNEAMTMTDFFNIELYKAEFDDIGKVVLRLFTESIFYIFAIETEINYAANLLTGGRLVQQLSDLAKGLPPEKLASLSISKILSINVAVILGLISFSLAMFNHSRVALFARYLLVPETQLAISQKNEIAKMLGFTTYHLIDYVMHSLWPIFFIYAMFLFTRHVQVLRESVEAASVIDETHLEAVKEKVTELQAKFRRMLVYFAFPLISIMTISIISIVGSCCFMAMNHKQQYYVSVLFSFGSFAFIRLVVICWAANLITVEYRELVRVLHEKADHWSADGWLCFSELRQLRGQFSVTFLECFSIQQSTILTALGFALNYIVVLLQTENYDHTSSRNESL